MGQLKSRNNKNWSRGQNVFGRVWIRIRVRVRVRARVRVGVRV